MRYLYEFMIGYSNSSLETKSGISVLQKKILLNILLQYASFYHIKKF